MGLCLYFHRTWTPGYNSEYIDPNLAYRYQRRLDLAKKVAWWVFILTLIICIVVLLIALLNRTPPTTTYHYINQEGQRVQLSTPHSDSGTYAPAESLSLSSSSVEDINRGESPWPAQVSTGSLVSSSSLPENGSFGDEPIDSSSLLSSSSGEESGAEGHYQLYYNSTEDKFETQNGSMLEGALPFSSSSRNSSISYVSEEQECLSPNFKCEATSVCLPEEKRCNGRFECMDNQKHFPSSKKIVDRSDEKDCLCSTISKPFYCNKNVDEISEQKCVHKNLVCDSNKDCENGRDEQHCTMISENLRNLRLNRHRPKDLLGYVLVQVKGSWHPYCSTHWTLEMGFRICKFLGYTNSTMMSTVGLDELNRRLGISLTGLGSSQEDGDFRQVRSPPLWLLGANDDYDVNTSGAIEEVITEPKPEETHNCTVGFLGCSRT